MGEGIKGLFVVYSPKLKLSSSKVNVSPSLKSKPLKSPSLNLKTPLYYSKSAIIFSITGSMAGMSSSNVL